MPSFEVPADILRDLNVFNEPGVKSLELKFNCNFPVSKFCTNHSSWNIFGEGKFVCCFFGGGEVKIQGGGNFSTFENVSICNDYRVSDIIRMGVKFSYWGKN